MFVKIGKSNFRRRCIILRSSVSALESTPTVIRNQHYLQLNLVLRHNTVKLALTHTSRKGLSAQLRTQHITGVMTHPDAQGVHWQDTKFERASMKNDTTLEYRRDSKKYTLYWWR